MGDVLGGRGPDGDTWPIYYWWPFSRAVPWSFEGQWALNAWPNFVITAGAIGLTLYVAWLRGFSPVGLVSRRWDGMVVAALRRRWPRGDGGWGG